MQPPRSVGRNLALDGDVCPPSPAVLRRELAAHGFARCGPCLLEVGRPDPDGYAESEQEERVKQDGHRSGREFEIVQAGRLRRRETMKNREVSR